MRHRPNSLIEDSTVDEGTTVNASQVYGSHLGPHNNIGPFTHVRVNTVTDYGVHLGPMWKPRTPTLPGATP